MGEELATWSPFSSGLSASLPNRLLHERPLVVLSCALLSSFHHLDVLTSNDTLWHVGVCISGMANPASMFCYSLSDVLAMPACPHCLSRFKFKKEESLKKQRRDPLSSSSSSSSSPLSSSGFVPTKTSCTCVASTAAAAAALSSSPSLLPHTDGFLVPSFGRS